MDFLRPYAPQLLSVLRIMSGLLLLQHGTTKYLSFPASQMSNASPTTMVGAAGVLELVGGVLLVIGLFTRPAAFILSGMCAVAYFWAHAGRGFYPLLNGGELAALHVRVPLPRCRRRRPLERRRRARLAGLILRRRFARATPRELTAGPPPRICSHAVD